ncbi:MAG: hypothetical protein ACREP8_00545, partial [Candidatus Binatia bacterium]
MFAGRQEIVRYCRFGAICLIVVFSFVLLHGELESALNTLKHGALFAKVKKDSRDHQGKQTSTNLPVAGAEWVLDIPAHFLRDDRKQNLRVWPVV